MIDVENRDSNIKVLKCDPPQDYILGGDFPHTHELKIYIKQDVLSAIDGYMASDTNNELGGVLVGNLCEAGDGSRFIYITNYIHAEHTTASVSRLTFNHETWEHFDREIEANYSDRMILGWYHSHPGHTVFLSGHDMFIQENFFNMDFMVAYVYDPTINDRGFFYWNDGKTERSSGYFIAVGENETVVPPAAGSVLEEEVNEDISEEINQQSMPKDYRRPEDYIETPNPEFSDDRRSGGGFKTFLIVILLLGNIVLSLFLFYQYTELEKRTQSSEQLMQDMSELKENYRNLNQKLENYIIESEIKEQNQKDTLLGNTGAGSTNQDTIK